MISLRFRRFSVTYAKWVRESLWRYCYHVNIPDPGLSCAVYVSYIQTHMHDQCMWIYLFIITFPASISWSFILQINNILDYGKLLKNLATPSLREKRKIFSLYIYLKLHMTQPDSIGKCRLLGPIPRNSESAGPGQGLRNLQHVLQQGNLKQTVGEPHFGDIRIS